MCVRLLHKLRENEKKIMTDSLFSRGKHSHQKLSSIIFKNTQLINMQF